MPLYIHIEEEIKLRIINYWIEGSVTCALHDEGEVCQLIITHY